MRNGRRRAGSSGTSKPPKIRMRPGESSAIIIVLGTHEDTAQLLGDQHEGNAG